GTAPGQLHKRGRAARRAVRDVFSGSGPLPSMSKLDRIYLWILAVGLVVFLIGAFSFLRGAPQTTIKGGMFGTAGQRPSACSTGDIYIETDATSGKRLRVCTATNTWDQLAVIAANSIT